MTASGTRFLMAPKNSVYMLTSSVSAIPHATGRPDKLKNSYYTCSKSLLPLHETVSKGKEFHNLITDGKKEYLYESQLH